MAILIIFRKEVYSMSIERMVYTGTTYFGEYARKEIITEIKKRKYNKALLLIMYIQDLIS